MEGVTTLRYILIILTEDYQLGLLNSFLAFMLSHEEWPAASTRLACRLLHVRSRQLASPQRR